MHYKSISASSLYVAKSCLLCWKQKHIFLQDFHFLTDTEILISHEIIHMQLTEVIILLSQKMA